MADKKGSIYYRDIRSFDFDRAFNFLNNKGLSNKGEPKNTKIIALDDDGDDYEINYDQVKEKAYTEDIFNIKLWLYFRWRIILTFRKEHGCFILEFHLFSLLHKEIDIVSKIFVSFFINEISVNKKSLLGMFIDRYGETYEYDFTPVFTTNSEKVDYITDLICLPKEKFGLVEIEPGFSMKELDNGFICASRYPEFLNYLMSSS